MLIRVSDLELRPLDFEQEFRPGAIDFGADLRQIGSLKIKGRAELVKEHHGGKVIVPNIRLIGEFSGNFEANCARCLETVPATVAKQFDLIYRPLGSDRRADEVSISEAETEIGYYQGDGMELADSLREQVLLALPIRFVCKEDCRGICPSCGQNLNEGPCQCPPAEGDVRLAAVITPAHAGSAPTRPIWLTTKSSIGPAGTDRLAHASRPSF